MNDALNTLANYLIAAGLVPAAVFTIDYVIIRPWRGFVPWWHSAIGVMFATLGLSISLVSLVVVCSLFLGTDYPGRPIVRVVAYAGFALAMVQLLAVYLIERNSATPLTFRRKERTNDRLDHQ